MKPGLIDQDMRHFGTVVGDILDPSDPVDMVRIGRVWHPKCGLVNPVGFAFDLVGKTKGLEHFHGPGVDAIGLAFDDIARHALHNHGVNVWKLGQLCGQAQSGRASARDQHIHFFWERLVGPSIAPVRCGLLDVGIAASKSIFIKLHCVSPGCEMADQMYWSSANGNCTYYLKSRRYV